MRGQRDKQAVKEAKAVGNAVEVIDVSEHKPRRISSAKWREGGKLVGCQGNQETRAAVTKAKALRALFTFMASKKPVSVASRGLDWRCIQ